MNPARFLPLLALPVLVAPISAPAQEAGLHYTHKDWELVCDNTRTCRAAGYSTEGAGHVVSALLTRKAGPGTPVTAEVMLGTYDDEPTSALPQDGGLMMRVNGRDIGPVVFDRTTLVGTLSGKQLQILLEVLPRKADIAWQHGGSTWRLSDQGAAAVLLKLDEVQGRLGTPGALVRRGDRDEAQVPPPLPLPVVNAVVPEDSPVVVDAGQVAALRERLRHSMAQDDACPLLTAPDAEPVALTFNALGKDTLLASTRCWSAAYNEGYGYWVVNVVEPSAPLLVTTSGSDYAHGSITAAHKGRGLGDCWSSNVWTWNGSRFAHTGSSLTGMCRLVAPGGAWDLPLIVTDVRPTTR